MHPLELIFEQQAANARLKVNVAADTLTETVQMVRSGGKPGYYYDLQSIPTGIAVDHATGMVTITIDALASGTASLTLDGIVTDLRGKTATAQAAVTFDPPPITSLVLFGYSAWNSGTNETMNVQYLANGDVLTDRGNKFQLLTDQYWHKLTTYGEINYGRFSLLDATNVMALVQSITGATSSNSVCGVLIYSGDDVIENKYSTYFPGWPQILGAVGNYTGLWHYFPGFYDNYVTNDGHIEGEGTDTGDIFSGGYGVIPKPFVNPHCIRDTFYTYTTNPKEVVYYPPPAPYVFRRQGLVCTPIITP